MEDRNCHIGPSVLTYPYLKQSSCLIEQRVEAASRVTEKEAKPEASKMGNGCGDASPQEGDLGRRPS